MNLFGQMIGALVEAWGEVKVQKARVILSLVGVVAAVAAMSTVIALGDLTAQSTQELTESYSGRSITLHISANQQSANSESQANGSQTTASPSASAADSSSESIIAGVNVRDPMGEAMKTVAARFEIPYWSRMEYGSVELKEFDEIRQNSSFRGVPVTQPAWGFEETMQIKAVDPAYATLFRLQPMAGGWIGESDAEQRLVPIVINSAMWDYLGRTPIVDPIILHSKDDAGTQYRVIGVVKSPTSFDSPAAYVSYDAWQLTKVSAAALGNEQPSGGNVEMLVWTGEDQAEQARTVLPSALASVLGKGWKGSVNGGEGFESGQSSTSTIRTVIMLIGGIVIFLGALGLLNVAIVTVRQRIREIGIRRAMGASAGRVFFAVFMESVVATFVAGVIGVAIAIVVLRFIPLATLGIEMQEPPAFPMSAAIAGVTISTSIGALCGIIPAFAAVRVKPIDAIRY